MKTKLSWKQLLGAALGLSLFNGAAVATDIMNPTRIVVLPYYVEKGADKNAGYEARHYRRMMKFINNQLVRHNFEVVNPFASDLKEAEYNKFMQRAREDSPLAAQEMTRKYATDAAYIVWLDVKKEHTADGYCKVRSRVEGEGYDSAARDLGVGVIKNFTVTRRDCEDAIVEAEKEVGDEVGRTLTAWGGRPTSGGVVSTSYAGGAAAAGDGRTEGVVQRRTDALANLINVRLEGATKYETVEVFGKVIVTARGVVEAKNYRTRIQAGHPQASQAIWRVRIEGTDPFRLQANVIKTINNISDAGGEITLKGVPYRYTAAEVDMLKGIRTGDTTSREIVFVVDRDRVRDQEFAERHDPYKARERSVPPRSVPGFD